MGVIRWSSYYTTIYGPSWSQAATAANNLGGYLASVTTESEFKFFQENNFKGWIGLSDPDNTGSVNADGSRGGWGKNGFRWESGEEYNFESWMQPVFNTDGNYVHFWEGHGGGGDTDMLATNEIPPNAPWWEGKGIAEIPLSYFSVSDLTIEEGEKGKVTISRTGGTQSSQTLTLTSSDGTAVVGDDYGRKNKTLTFAAGETSKTVNIVSKEDDLVEGDETFTLTLSASGADAVPAQISDGTATVTITDDDQPSYSIIPEASSVNEGIRFRTNVSTTGVAEGTRLYWTLSGTGIDANDFSAGSLQGSRLVKSDGTITFAHTLAADATTEGTETLEIKLYSDWARTTQVGDTATVTINDTSVTNPSYYSVADTQAYEGDTLYLKASRTGNISLAHDLTLSLTNGTAFQGFDFTPPSTTVSFLAGESSKLIAIQSIEDTLVEPDEAFSITLSSTADTALFTDDTATLTILNDDAAPVTITNITTNTVNNNQTYLNYNSYSVDNSRNYNIRVGGNINTGGGSFVLGGDGNSVGNSTTTTTINADFKYTGTATADHLLGSQGANGEAWAHDFFDAGAGDDFLGGVGGRDVMNGGVGDDELRAGYGHDILDGGVGEDILYGGGGRNTFNNNDDGDFDQLFVLSDYHSHN